VYKTLNDQILNAKHLAVLMTVLSVRYIDIFNDSIFREEHRYTFYSYKMPTS